jgi:predicted Fe-Mo cluster-binding NifX family protein
MPRFVLCLARIMLCIKAEEGGEMKIALTVWEDRISPVFDAATTLLLAELEDSGILEKHLAPLPPVSSTRLPETLQAMGVSVLICGAISEGHANRLASNGIELIPFVSGKTERILDAYAKGKPIVPAFSMPGCGRRGSGRMVKPTQNTNCKGVTKMPRKDGTGPAGKGQGNGKGRGRCKSGTGPGTGKEKDTGQGRGGRREPGQGRRQR